MAKIALLWFRQDLRLHDNDAVEWAITNGYSILPFFHYSTSNKGSEWARGSASKWWLHHALSDLDQQLSNLGSSLVIGDPDLPVRDALLTIMERENVEAVLWNRNYEPQSVKHDTALKTELKNRGILAKSVNSNLLFDPLLIQNKSKSPFRVFTPFWKHLKNFESPTVPTINLDSANWHSAVSEVQISDLPLIPEIPWHTEMDAHWTPTRSGALARVSRFIEQNAHLYPDQRDRPDLDGTSQMSPYLHFGQIGPRELLAAFRATDDSIVESGVTRQLFWREFGYHLLFHFPNTPTKALFEKYDLFPWEENRDALHAWQKGQTGYPIVDAAMRQLWHTGWMHNRCRMIAGSLFVKHLLLPWQEGAKWFWDTLVDADLANNTMGWQWVAGTGADASPYFRIFNPITQGQKFDPNGDYIRKWCPELKGLPTKFIHYPIDAPKSILEHAGVALGSTYPKPIIGHPEGRQKALDAFAEFKDLVATN